MTEAIIVAVITSSVSLVGIIVSAVVTSSKSAHAIAVSQAVTETKLDELTREVREHNGFARRMPVVEEQIKELTNRVSIIEKKI